MSKDDSIKGYSLLAITFVTIALLYFFCQRIENYQSITTTTTDPVIRYERPIPTNYNPPSPTKTKNLNLYNLVKKPAIKPGLYTDDYKDMLITNGIYSFSSNFNMDGLLYK
jgi:hypothetical protein